MGRRWYVVAWDTDRAGWRTFRLDRIADPWVMPGRVSPREVPGGDAVAWVRSRVEGGAPMVEAVVVVDAAEGEVRARLADALVALEPIKPGRVRIRLGADTVPWQAMQLIRLEAPFRVEQPPELRAWLAASAARMTAAAEGP